MMTRNVVLLSAVVVLFLVNDPSLAGGYCQDQQKDCDNIGRQETRSQQLSDLSTDFETGSANFWTDASQTGIRWKIEESNSAWELNNPAPQPLVGRNYMRVNRGVSLSFGVAVLRSPTIQIPPSSTDTVAKISFDFWIRSKWPQFTNLELYLNENGNEKLLASLSEYSEITNTNWVTYQFSVLPFSNGYEFSLAFYAYCGTDVEDAVAIDNIRWIDPFALNSTEDCGADLGIATSTVREIRSQGYPNFYKVNQYCYYTIRGNTKNSIVRLNFYDIDMGTNDFVKVKDGGRYSTNPREILKLTGNSSLPGYDEPPKAVADCQSGVCLIEHFSDSSPKGNLRGWNATYSECGGIYYSYLTKRITSPNYPNFYYSNQTCYYYIYTSSTSTKILLKFDDFFEMEAQHDYLKIYNGLTIGSPLLFQATGYPGFNSPFNQLSALPYTIFSNGTEILIQHFSDYSVHGSLKGWSVYILEILDDLTSSTSITQPTVKTTTTQQTTSTTTSAKTIGTTTSPIWTYETTSLTTEGATVDEITTESWTTEPATTATPTTERPECGGFFNSTLTDTNITSPGYPNFYQVNQFCYYHIFKGISNSIVRLNFYDIDMETNDFVKVYDGVSILNSPEILELTGNSSLPGYYEPPKAVADCQSDVCLIQHFSGSSPKGTLRGWRATYSECGGYYNVFETEISITSPNYPNFYHTKQTCNYTIYSSFNNKIRLEIIDFHMEAQHDWFKVYDGRTTNSSLLFQATAYPGFNAPFNQLPDSLPHSIISSGSEILIEHISDYSDHGSLRGWSVNISEIVDDVTSSTISN